MEVWYALLTILGMIYNIVLPYIVSTWLLFLYHFSGTDDTWRYLSPDPISFVWKKTEQEEKIQMEIKSQVLNKRKHDTEQNIVPLNSP